MVVTGVVVITVEAGSFDASHDAVTPVPARVRKRRRVTCGRAKKLCTGCGYLRNNWSNFSCSFMRVSVIEHEVDFVKQRPQQVLGGFGTPGGPDGFNNMES